MVLMRHSCTVLVITLGRDLFNEEEEIAVMWTRLVELRMFQWQLF
jgi:hypothetical protein